MTLGEKIHQLRTEHHMSQGDLANALEVSRQSVSKWETNASVPELDKLVRMSEVFRISLDELVRGTKPEDTARAVQDGAVPTEKTGLPARKMVGFVFLGAGLLVFLLLAVLTGPRSALFLSAPLFLCAAICLLVRKYAALWCFWALYAIVYAYLRYATGIRFWWVFCGWLYREGLEIHAMIAWAMTLGVAALIAATGRIFFRNRKCK